MKRQGGKSEQSSPPSSAEVKGLWSLVSSPPYVLVTWCLQACFVKNTMCSAFDVLKSTAKVCARLFVDRCQRQVSILVILARDSTPSDATEEGFIVVADVGVRGFARYTVSLQPA
jgi:hypothetical protein